MRSCPIVEMPWAARCRTDVNIGDLHSRAAVALDGRTHPAYFFLHNNGAYPLTVEDPTMFVLTDAAGAHYWSGRFYMPVTAPPEKLCVLAFGSRAAAEQEARRLFRKRGAHLRVVEFPYSGPRRPELVHPN